MMFAATFAISRFGAATTLIRRSYRQWRSWDFSPRAAAVLAVKYFNL